MKRLLLAGLFWFLFAPIAHAAIQVETGTFVLNTAGTTTTVTTGFQGKAVILYSHCKTGLTETAFGCFSIGISNGTNFRSITWGGDSAVATTNAAHSYQTTKALQIYTDGTPTSMVGGQVQGVAFNATPNMVLTMNGTPASAIQVSYILFGGADITNTFVGDFALNTAVGAQSITTVGFQGNFLFTFNSRSTAAIDAVHSYASIGVATSSSKQWAWSGVVQDAQTLSGNVNGMSNLRNDATFLMQTITNANDAVADFTQWTSNGFDINVSDGAPAADLCAILVLKGGQWDLGTQAKPATATTQTVNTMSFQPKLLGYFLSSPTVLNTYTSNEVSTFGAATGTTARNYADGFHNDAINTVANSAGSSTAISHEANGGTSADFTSFNSNGWTITWAGAGTAFLSGWFAAGDSPVGGLVIRKNVY